MSVQTTADEQLDLAKADVKTAIDHLAEIVIKQCWGHDEFNDAYYTNITHSLADLLRIRDRLES